MLINNMCISEITWLGYCYASLCNTCSTNQNHAAQPEILGSGVSTVPLSHVRLPHWQTGRRGQQRREVSTRGREVGTQGSRGRYTGVMGSVHKGSWVQYTRVMGSVHSGRGVGT